jgi:plastocyanin
MKTTRRMRYLLTGAVAAAALAATGSSTAASAKTVTGTVGPGFTISLTVDGKNVTKLKAGVPYHFVIRDRADIHDFHLSGPGLNRVLTSVEFVGTKSLVLRLKKGSYSFVCDPHASIMHGRLRVS